jgi:2-polyprenyl-3-methyl-5-hydroxy-6-metoxy-1,4-benzoquinol methylase
MSQAVEYDRQYRVWLARQGPGARDLEWRLRHLLWRQRVLLRWYPPAGQRVLDYGCMDGVFTFALERAGARVVGYDVSSEAIAQAVAFRASAATPIFTTAPPERAAFDLVFCCEVLEHMRDDRAFVGELVRYLAPGGRVVGTTPVGRAFWDPDHKRTYDDEASLRRALEPWGCVKVRRYYRTPLRNLLPLKQRGAAVFVFEVTPPVRAADRA